MSSLTDLPVEDRMQLVEALWDSIAVDQDSLPVTDEQREELDRRLQAYEEDQDPGRDARDAISEIRDTL